MAEDRRDYVQSTARVVAYVYLLLALEWLFFLTTPSFLSAAPLTHAVGALLVAALPFAAAVLLLHGALALLALRLSRPALLRVVPALVVAATALMLIDNFTYTLFGLGVVSTGPLTRLLYWVLLGGAFALHFRRPATRWRGRTAAAGVLLLASGLALAIPLALARSGGGGEWNARGGVARTGLPNIVLFASDGVDAARTSAYGYARSTTPHLDDLLPGALVAENAFTNSGWSTGSITSMMTGKHPATTKVLYPPYTLQGRDAYQSLPRILRGLGYAGIQESVRYYADGPDLNWKDSFDFANGRAVPQELLPGGARLPAAAQLAQQFGRTAYQRLRERVRHVFYVERMVNVHQLVTSPEYARVYGTSDEDRMNRVIDFIRSGKRPFFAHLHLMDTHCCTFKPRAPHFSAAAPADRREREAAQQDDVIREADGHFGRLMAVLEAEGILDQTIVVYSSDHPKGWGFKARVPLVFRFPDGRPAGRVQASAQLLDVAPTLLDFLGESVPPWMEGHSLLRGEPDPHRPIFAIDQLHRVHFKSDERERLAKVRSVGPPDYALKQLGMVACDRWYTLELSTGKVGSGKVDGHTGECDERRLPTREQAAEQMSRHLSERGFSF